MLNRDNENRYSRLVADDSGLLVSTTGSVDDMRRQSAVASAVAATIRRRAAPNRFTLRLALADDAKHDVEQIVIPTARSPKSRRRSRFCCLPRSTPFDELDDDSYEPTIDESRPTPTDDSTQRQRSSIVVSTDTASTSASTPSSTTLVSPTRLPPIVCRCNCSDDFYIAFDGPHFTFSDLFECPAGIVLEGEFDRRRSSTRIVVVC